MAVYTPLDYLKSFVILLLIFWFLRRYLFNRIEIDRGFMLALIPPVALAITVRMLADAGVYPKSEWWSVTPGVYVLGVAYGFVLVRLGMLAEKRLGVEYWKVVLLLGALTLPPFLLKLLTQMQAPLRFLYPLALAGVATLLVVAPAGVLRLRFLTGSNALLVFAHMLDASGTFVGVDYFGFGEEHILAEFFINLTGTAAVMYPLKLAVLLPVLYLLERWREEENELTYYWMVKLAIFILGLGPGLRNSLLLTLV
ncbi:MAG: DUF63 family protein [Euryarchaeota archaeon]|nr:DUF63 family protein [Euryarchaeota archaeon]